MTPQAISPSSFQKQQIRATVLSARERLLPSFREDASQRIAARIMKLPSFLAAQTVLLFAHFGSEWASTKIVQEALRMGKQVALPRVVKKEFSTPQLLLHTIDTMMHDTLANTWGIHEPLSNRPILKPDAVAWVLVPGVAFSPNGMRLGYGAGFYDRLLPQISPDAPRIAGAFDLQMLETLPSEALDCRVDAVYTETRAF